MPYRGTRRRHGPFETGQRALYGVPRDGQRQTHVAGASESRTGDGKDALLLQQADELDVVGDGRLGKEVKCALRTSQVVAHGFEGIAQPVALRLVLRDVHRSL